MPIISSPPGVTSLSETGVTPAIKGAVTLTEGSNITITQSGQAITIAAAAAGSVDLIESTIFETAARFTGTATDAGTVTFNDLGMTLNSGTTAGSYNIEWKGAGGGGFYLDESPVFSVSLTGQTFNKATAAGSFYTGIGAVTVATTGHTFTTSHIGFKVIKTGGAINVYGTQANGTTETATASLTTGFDDNITILLSKTF